MKPALQNLSKLLIAYPLAIQLLFCLVAGCTFSPTPPNSERELVNLIKYNEVELGKSAYLQTVQKNGGRYHDVELVTYLNNLGNRLARQSLSPNLQFSFSVINDSMPDAFAFPGGYIAITRGLLVNLSNESQLAALLSHEIGHATARHSLQGVQTETLSGRSVGGMEVEFSGTSPNTTSIAGIASTLVNKGYSVEQEAEAERLANNLMVAAGYDPSGAVLLQDIFYRKGEDGKNPRAWDVFFNKHSVPTEGPTTSRRYVAENDLFTVGVGPNTSEFAKAFQGLAQTRQGYSTYDLARQLEQKGHLAEAISLFHQALLEAPDEALILCRLGLAYLRNEDLVPARRYLIKAINLQGDYYQAHLALGYVYQQKKEHQKAREQLELGFKQLPTLEGGYLLAEAHENVGDSEAARVLYLAVAKADVGGKLGRNASERLKLLDQ